MKASQHLIALLFVLLFSTPSFALQIVNDYTINPSCGHNNGRIYISVGGGISPYTYQWSNGQTTSNVNNLPPGTYTLTVHDAVNATATKSWTLVNQPTFFADVLSFDEPTQFPSVMGHPCRNLCNGIGWLHTDHVGGTPPYTMSANPFHPTTGNFNGTQIPAVMNICATDYFTVTVTDVFGCTGQANWNSPGLPNSFSCFPQIFGSCSNGSVGHASFEFTNTQGFFYNASWTGPESGYASIFWPPILNLDSLTPGNYTLTVENPYTYYSCDTVINFTILNNVPGPPPATPGSITAVGGVTKACPGETKTYSIAPVSGATSYYWTPPQETVITAGQGTTSVSIYFYGSFPASDTLRVTANNSCGSSAQRKLKISRNEPAIPGAITATGGNTKVCPGNTKTYSISPVASATSYTWRAPTGGIITSGQGTTTVNVFFNSLFTVSDTIHVRTNNGCGFSANRNLVIPRNNPATPSVVTGQNYGLCNVTGIPYSVINVPGMTYNWSFGGAPATIASGQGSSQITANYNPTFISGTLSVTASNTCGTSNQRKYNVFAKPPTPASITGATSVCVNQQNVPYSISPIPNITNYTWTGPSGSHISDGINTSAGTTLITTSTSVTIDYGTVAGSVKVRANNSCASGSYKSISIAIVCREGFVENESELFDASITPNPNSGSFTIQLSGSTSDIVQASITNSLGQKVYDFEIRNQHSDFDLKLESGIYFVELIDSRNKITRKIIVQ